MYKLKSLELVNLLSHKNTKYEFVDGVAIMILGKNKDDDGQESNGGGKSVIEEGVHFGFTGNALRKAKDADLIFYGEDSAVIKLELFNPIIEEELTIIRTLYAKKSKSTTIEIILNGDPDKIKKSDVREYNKWILEKIGISREDLQNYFVVSKTKSASFFGQSDTDKKKIVSRFSGTDPLIPIREKIKDDLASKKTDMEAVELKINNLNVKKETLAEQSTVGGTEELEKLKLSRIKSREDQIELKHQSTSQLKEEIVRLDLDMIEATETWEKHKTSLSELKEIDYTKEITDERSKDTASKKIIEDTNKEVTELTTYVRESNTLITDVEKIIAGEIECPSCNHLFVLSSGKFTLEEAKLKKVEAEEIVLMCTTEIKTHQETVTLHKDKIRQVDIKVDAIRKKSSDQEDKKDTIKTAIRKVKSEVDSINLKINGKNESILSAGKYVEERLKEIEEITNEVVTDPSLLIVKQIDSVKLEVIEQEKELDVLKDGYLKLKEFEVVFVKFFTHLSNKAVKSIQIKVNQQLRDMNSNLSIKIEGYKVLADGTIKDTINTVVLRDGIPEAFLGNYSEGEIARIKIAGVLALNDLINKSCEYSNGLDFAMLDEMFESVDPLGVGNIMNSLNGLNKTILCISHISPKFPYSNTITSVKEGGVSTIRL